MRVVLFCHSLASCWNHGNAHFLRGVARELLARGHALKVLEPADGWSRRQLEADQGKSALDGWHDAYLELTTELYQPVLLEHDLDRLLEGADLVLVHEWTEPEVVRALGRRRRAGGTFRLLYHDTHHRLISAGPNFLDNLDGFDGVLAFGASLAERYRAFGWGERVWVWHEAADVTVFHPCPEIANHGGLVWIGNWGDEERTAELGEFLLRPIAALGLPATVHGVRYPAAACASLARHGIDFRGWLPNHRVPEIFAAHQVTVHVPRRFYAEALPGIPTIRVFEALACGIPLVSAPWSDSEGLFGEGCFLIAENGAAMTQHLRAVLADDELRTSLIKNGLGAIHERHTCAHRVDELLAIHAGLKGPAPASLETIACA